MIQIQAQIKKAKRSNTFNINTIQLNVIEFPHDTIIQLNCVHLTEKLHPNQRQQ